MCNLFRKITCKHENEYFKTECTRKFIGKNGKTIILIHFQICSNCGRKRRMKVITLYQEDNNSERELIGRRIINDTWDIMYATTPSLFDENFDLTEGEKNYV